MKIEADARIAFPRETVFSAYRDNLSQMAKNIPNVSKIEVRETEENVDGVEGRVRKFNVWSAVSEIPKMARVVIKPEMLAWDDHAVWDVNDWTCEWRIETHFFQKQVHCAGKNRFLEVDGVTLMEIRGSLEIDAKNLPGVPKMLGGKIGPMIESFVVKLITPNFVTTANSVEAYLRENA